jgi:hypothetical protein
MEHRYKDTRVSNFWKVKHSVLSQLVGKVRTKAIALSQIQLFFDRSLTDFKRGLLFTLTFTNDEVSIIGMGGPQNWGSS